MHLTTYQRHWWEFLLAMTVKEIKARYKHAFFGFLWIIINPLLQMLVIGFVFQFFVPVHVDNYFLFLFSGLLPWNFFAYSITKSTPSIVFERSLIQKAKFPRETIVLSIVLSNLFHFLISLSLLIVLLVGDKIWFDHYSSLQLLSYAARMFWVIPLAMWLTSLTVGLSLLSAALNVKYRDVNFAIQAIMPLWFYATPILYTLNLLPRTVRSLFYLNPMTAIMEGFQFVLLRQPFTSPHLVVVTILLTMMLTFFGWNFFRTESKYFDDWV